MAGAPTLIAPVPAPESTGWKARLARIAAFLEALAGDQFAAPEVRIRHLEARIVRLEAAAARKEV